MKTLYSSLLLMLSMCLAQAGHGQAGISLPGQLDNNSRSPSSLIDNPPGNCSLTKYFSNTSGSIPCYIYGFAKAIPIQISEPCENDEECPGSPGSCPARAGIYSSANWPLGCIPIQIVDNSHAHYSTPFLFATFNGEVHIMLFGDIIDVITISVSTSERVGHDCCLAF